MKTIIQIVCCIVIYGSGMVVGFQFNPRNRQEKVFRITAYCPNSCCCGKWADGQTASGHWIRPGDKFIAAPKNVPFNTEFIVPGYNNGRPVKVLDRGGVIKGNRLDVFFETHREAKEWGNKRLIVKML